MDNSSFFLALETVGRLGLQLLDKGVPDKYKSTETRELMKNCKKLVDTTKMFMSVLSKKTDSIMLDRKD